MNDMRDDRDEFTIERRDRTERASGRDSHDEARSTNAAPIDTAPSATKDDAFPERIRRKYYVVAEEVGKNQIGQETNLYADERGEYLAFKAQEDRLVTRLAAVEVIRDMVSVAQHRHWQALHVRGSKQFRREAWLEASAHGMEVQGYEPTELERQALAARREVWERTRPRNPEAHDRSAPVNSGHSARFDYDAGVSGRLIEVGQAPYRNRVDAERSAYLTVELDDGRRHQLWGVGLERATADSNARPGDRIHVRRDGVEHVQKEIKVIDAASGKSRNERRQVPRNQWRVTAAKFRSADRQAAARDRDLVAAQSQMVIIEKALERAFPENQRVRASILNAAQERIAQHLEQGHSFGRATVIEPVQDRDRSGNDRGDARQNQNQVWERIQDRER
ncbi:LPD7 domain-containing protein [Bradyrhizobium sp. LHD-71]|uniref:LPD7 domain-containing protein n=1 Tax=Bradyrhizobium sp. LHD-71 TaxID=3072141 RepID=UPI00280DC0F8|nr:LPD7 domain-containing protein [Bradyrhizobium sp. LHD-71]MDQ8727525.1 LPD7 domain-containing protein [Bradyrhizobium sp. LHD-71]